MVAEEPRLADHLTADEIETALRALGVLGDGHEVWELEDEAVLDVVAKLRLLV